MSEFFRREDLRRQIPARLEQLDSGIQEIAATSLATRALSVLERVGLVPDSERYVAGTVAIRGEIDQGVLLRTLVARGFRVALPTTTTGPEKSMTFHSWESGDELIAGNFGVPEPQTPTIANEAITAMFVPGIAFDRAGNRVGYGAGYFDRFLSTFADRPLLIGVAHDLQVLDFDAPRNWDVPVDWLITPTRSIEISSR